MRSIPWWGWLIILVILIGLFPGLYHALVSHLGSGLQTICPNCSSGG